MFKSNYSPKYLGIYTSATPTETIKFANDYYKRAYDGLFSELLNLGCTPVLLFDQAVNYLGKGIFKQFWEVAKHNDQLKFTHHGKTIKIDFLFDKNRFTADDIPTCTPREVREICRDKYQSYLFAPKWHAPTYLTNNLDHLNVFFKSHRDLVAIKELDSNSGKKVFVGKASDYDHSFEYPLIAQEFLDSSIGIPGICEGRHDLRTAIYNGKVISLLLRQPPKGGLKSNMPYGGNLAELSPSLMPKSLSSIIKTIDTGFAANNPDRFYSIDFCNTPDGWKIFELNAWPGLGYDSKNEQLFTKRLAKCLVSSLDTAIANNMKRKENLT